MAKLKLPKNILMWVIGALFIMSIMPGEGTKASSQQAIVTTDYICSTVDDCPKCVGSGISDFNATDVTFLGELSFSDCVGGVCELSDACLVWDCPTGAGMIGENGTTVPCESVKKTILDNTIVKFNENPAIVFLALGLIVAFYML